MIAKNKKGTIAMYGTAFGLLLAIVLFFYYSGQTDKYMTNFGMDQTRIMGAYQQGEKMLIYVDRAAKVSMEQSAYDLVNRAFFPGDNMLSALNIDDETFIIWKYETVSNGDGACVINSGESFPTIAGAETGFWEFTQEKLSSHIAQYNVVRIDEYDLPDGYNTPVLSSENGKTVLTAQATNQIVIEDHPVTYKVSPSFKQSIDIDLFGDLALLRSLTVGKTKQEVDTSSAMVGEQLSWVVKSRATQQGCMIDDDAGWCCYERMDSCDVEQTDEDMLCPCIVDGKERVYRTHAVDEYGISSDTGKKLFVETQDGVKEEPIIYRFALAWIDENSYTDSTACVKDE